MEAGRELDALVAEKVMGLKVGKIHEVYDPPLFDGAIEIYERWDLVEPKPYSTDIAAAWEVVEKLSNIEKPRLEGFQLEVTYSNAGMYARAQLLGDDPGKDIEVSSDSLSGRLYSAPLAICLAALKAVGA